MGWGGERAEPMSKGGYGERRSREKMNTEEKREMRQGRKKRKEEQKNREAWKMLGVALDRNLTVGRMVRGIRHQHTHSHSGMEAHFAAGREGKGERDRACVLPT